MNHYPEQAQAAMPQWISDAQRKAESPLGKAINKASAPIAQHLDIAHAALTRLDSILAELCERLSPTLADPEPPPAAASLEPTISARSPIEHRIVDLTCNINNLSRRIDDVLGRCRL